MIQLAKFKFKSQKGRNKFNFITDNDELLNDEMVKGTHIEMFSNQKMILDGCQNIIDYQNDYVKLKLKKGNLTIMGTDFLISAFENENIIIKGNISTVEFCI